MKKKLSKQQKLILRTIYQDYKKNPMRKFWSDIKTVDGHIKWESRNRWREGINGSMQTKKLSGLLSKKLNKRCSFNYREEAKKNYDEFKKTGNAFDLRIAHYLSCFINKPEKNWQTASFRSSLSRSFKRLTDRGLIENVIFKDSGYNYGFILTPEGEKVARKIKLSECLPNKRLTNEVVK